MWKIINLPSSRSQYSNSQPLKHEYFPITTCTLEILKYFVLSSNNLTEKKDTSGIWTRVVVVEGEHVDHLTDTKASYNY